MYKQVFHLLLHYSPKLHPPSLVLIVPLAMEGFYNLLSKFSLTESAAPVPETAPRQVVGTPEEIAKYVYRDILGIKNEIRSYNQVTGILHTNLLYYKLLKLMEEDHYRQLEELKRRCEYQVNSSVYQRKLVDLYRSQLSELCNLLDILKNNYNHGIHESHIINHRARAKSVTASPPRTGSHGDGNNSIFSGRSRSSSISTQASPKQTIPISLEPDKNDKNERPAAKFSQPYSQDDIERITNEAPDHLLDPISFQLFSDPVITPSGITYEKANIVRYLRNKGNQDPLTRVPLREDQLYPNLVLKDTVDEYIQSKEQDIKV